MDRPQFLYAWVSEDDELMHALTPAGWVPVVECSTMAVPGVVRYVPVEDVMVIRPER